MKILSTVEAVRSVRKDYGRDSLGFVPTMGFLHEGHLALVKRALAENDHVAVSIYVNPTQFGPTEDLSRYPRNLERDCELLENEGIDFVFVPDDGTVYPPDYQTTVQVTRVTQSLEGARRPTHFMGVTTIVTKLFNIINPTKAYFGQKDAQQAVVIQQMVRDLNFDLEIIVCPTVREPDGLAMSSRNKYLTAEQRYAATALYRSLQAAKIQWFHGVRDGDTLREAMMDVLSSEPQLKVDYVSAAHPVTLNEWGASIPIDGSVLLSLAAFLGQTRLIDNFLLAHEAG